MATVRKLKFQDRLFYIILYFLLGVFCFSTLYPLSLIHISEPTRH